MSYSFRIYPKPWQAEQLETIIDELYDTNDTIFLSDSFPRKFVLRCEDLDHMMMPCDVEWPGISKYEVNQMRITRSEKGEWYARFHWDDVAQAA